MFPCLCIELSTAVMLFFPPCVPDPVFYASFAATLAFCWVFGLINRYPLFYPLVPHVCTLGSTLCRSWYTSHLFCTSVTGYWSNFLLLSIFFSTHSKQFIILPLDILRTSSVSPSYPVPSDLPPLAPHCSIHLPHHHAGSGSHCLQKSETLTLSLFSKPDSKPFCLVLLITIDRFVHISFLCYYSNSFSDDFICIF